MDIAVLSMGLNQMKIAQQASISAMKMTMDTAKINSAYLTQMLETNTKMMERSVNPHLRENIDIML